MKKFDVSIIAVSILLLGLVILGVSQEQDRDPVVAMVGNKPITQSQLYNAMKDKYGKKVLNQLVADDLVLLEAQQLGVAASEEEIDKELSALKKVMGTEEKFQKYLKDKQLDEQGLRAKLSLLLTRDKLLDQAYPVTEKQIKEYYDKYKEKLGKPTPTLEQATQKIREKLTDRNRRNHFSDWINELEKKYGVEYVDPALAKNEDSKSDDNKKTG
jgi:foldase protein PrsA